jgi:glycerate 2-kinase
VRVLIAPDKFRGTATAAEAAAALADGVHAAGHHAVQQPMADGGEGTLDVLGGPNRTTVVTGPLGDLVEAGWRLSKREAVIEMAAASGLVLAGGKEGNDPIAASTYGTGELISAALEAGAKRIVVAVGGSATTDGGLGALRAIHPLQRLRGVDLEVACDVQIRFTEAARVFAPQKGATPAQVELLERRLERLVQVYEEEHGRDIGGLPGGGAAGGLAGALAAVGARLVPGFDLVADKVDLDETVEGCDLVITGEGFLDLESFDGKVVGGVLAMATDLGKPVVAVVGECFDGAAERLRTVSLVQRFGRERALDDVLGCLREVGAEVVGGSHPGGAG